jgi:hypothetical protein
MEGNSEDASLRSPGRNERRSTGQGKRRAPRCRAIKASRLEPDSAFQLIESSSRDGRSVERSLQREIFSNFKGS